MYPKALEDFMLGRIDWVNTPSRFLLMNRGYTYSTSHEFVSSFEPACVVAQSDLLTNKVMTTDPGFRASADDAYVPEFSPPTEVAYLILIADTGSPLTSSLIAYYDDLPGLPAVLGDLPVYIAPDARGLGLFADYELVPPPPEGASGE
jgi:hypothetical protein